MNLKGDYKSKTIIGKSPDELDKKANEWLKKNPLNIGVPTFTTFPVQNKPDDNFDCEIVTHFCLHIMYTGEEAQEPVETNEAEN